MSRLSSRFGVRALSVVLLLVAVVGGLYLTQDRTSQQQALDAGLAYRAEAADLQTLREHNGERVIADLRQEAARRIAAAKAEQAAKDAAERARRAEQEASRRRAERSAPTGPPDFGPIPASCDEYSGNRAIGCALMLEKGFPLREMTCLDKLWTKESGWNHRAQNPSSGAYGIPQALPGSKMGTVASDWETNPATQIIWGLGYIKDRYGTPCGAWQHFLDNGWY